ncbi:MAG: hypothetical protein ACI8QC_002412 [Planctomycetota bacterium]|jgi:hypothetical protein
MTESEQQAPKEGQQREGQLGPEPTLMELVLANFRVLAGVAFLAALAFGVWYGLALLFPELSWLQISE